MTTKMLFMLVLLLGTYESGGLQIGHSSQASTCDISFPFTSRYISAFLEHRTQGSGCVTNATTPSSEEVHVIKFQSGDGGIKSEREDIALLVKTINDKDHSRPVIVVLSSQQPVRWKLRTEHISTTVRHIFVVPRHSRVSVASKGLKVKVKKNDKLPTSTHSLLEWAENQYGVVTSLTEVQHGNKVLLKVGIDPDSPATCEIHHNQATLRAMSLKESPEVLSGCTVSDRRFALARVAYVVEVTKVDVDPDRMSDVEVELDISGSGRRVTRTEFWLVLKSPSNVTWKIHTRKVQGHMDIVTNSHVDMNGIRMHTVGLRPEEIPDCGKDLVQWVEYYIGPVALYSGIPLANKIKLVLPHTDQSDNRPGKGIGTVLSPYAQPSHTKTAVGRAIQTECHHGSLKMAIDKIFIQMFGLTRQQLTLLLPTCLAKENNTHMYLTTEAGECGTKEEVINRTVIYRNALLIHPKQVFNLPDSGSGMGRDHNVDDDEEEMSGSGSHNILSETYLDDEDFQDNSIIRVDFSCQSRASDVIIEQDIPIDGDVSFTLDLCSRSSFSKPAIRFPMPVPVPGTIYVQASINAVSNLRVQIYSCWLSTSLGRHGMNLLPLIEHGCLKDPTVRWSPVPNGNSVRHGLAAQSQRFSFRTESYMGPNNNYAFMKCRLTVCRKDRRMFEDKDIPLCIEDTMEYCRQQTAHQGEATLRSKTLDRGPMELSDEIVEDPFDYQPSDITPPPPRRSGVNSPSQGSNNTSSQSIIIEGLDSGTVVGIAFAAFIIGVLLMAALWFIHTHTGPVKHSVSSRGSTESSGESTPSSSAPIKA